MKKTTRTLVALALAASLGLAGCGSDASQSDASDQSSGSADSQAAPEVDRSGDGPFPAVEGDFGTEPVISAGEGEQPTDKIYAKTLTKGTGDTVVETGAVAVNYTGVLWDGTVFDSSFSNGEATPVAFSLDQVITGWKYGLANQKVGDRVELVIPAEWAYGDTAQGSIPAGSTLTFVVDIIQAVDRTDTSALKDAQETGNALPDGLTIEGAPGEAPEVTFADGAAIPSESSTIVISEGKGATITDQDYVLYQGWASLWGDTSSAQSSWGQPAEMVNGAAELVGQKVGSRVLLTYVPDAEAQSGAQAQIMIVDIVGTLSTSGS